MREIFFDPDRRKFIRLSAASSLALPWADHVARVIRDVCDEEQDSRPKQEPAPPEVRVAFIGIGGRGSFILRSHGYWRDEELREAGYAHPPHSQLPSIKVAAICDVYQPRVDEMLRTLAKYDVKATGTQDWHKIIDDKNIDAVFITTPDLWHGPIALAAMEAGKDVYVEKCMTNNLEEAKQLREVVHKTGKVLQVGHQNRHNTYQRIAARLYKEGVLGNVHLVETGVGRNNKEGAYATTPPPRITSAQLAWDLFSPKNLGFAFDADRAFNWRKYWAYSTGIAGDLMSHDIDAVNRILELSIPDTVTALGGIYAWKDGRETPDHYSVLHDYKDRGIVFHYSASLANSYERKTTIMGSDANLLLGFELKIYPDHGSTRYAEELKSGKFNPYEPFIAYAGPPASAQLATAPTLAWADGKGLTFTDLGGQRADVTRLAIEEFYMGVRGRRKPQCGVEEGFGR
jgi:predicted dehydrogenase